MEETTKTKEDTTREHRKQMTEKCLVAEAMEKCPCERCKTQREYTKLALDSWVRLIANKIWWDSLREAEKKEVKQ